MDISCNPLSSTTTFINSHPAFFLRSSLIVSIAIIIIGGLGLGGLLPMGTIGGSCLLSFGAIALVLIICLRSYRMYKEGERLASGVDYGNRKSAAITPMSFNDYLASIEASSSLAKLRQFFFIETTLSSRLPKRKIQPQNSFIAPTPEKARRMRKDPTYGTDL